AAFVTAAIDGALPPLDPAALMASVAVIDPFSDAVTVPELKREPCAASVAVETPPMPTSCTVPRGFDPCVTATDPAGVEPSDAVALAVRNTVSFAPTDGTLLCSVSFVVTAGASIEPDHFVKS